GSLAQAKKGGSRRHGAKALDLDVGGRAAGQDPPYEASGGQQAGQDPPYEASSERQAGQDPPYGAVDLDLDLRGPSGAAEAADQTPQGRRAGMRGVFRAGRMPARKIPPAPRTRCAAPGAQAGGAFFAPGFFAQAKKGGSRRHGAKAFDLDVGGRAAGQDPPYEASAGQLAGQDPPYGAVAGDAEEQEQLAALAPSSGASRHLLPQAGEGLFDCSSASGRRDTRPILPQAGEGLFGCSPASGRRAVRLLSRKREKGYSTDSPAGGRRAVRPMLPQAGEGLFDRCSRQREKGCAVRPRSAAGRQERGGPGVQQLLRDVDPDRLGPRRIAGALRAHGHAVVGRTDQ